MATNAPPLVLIIPDGSALTELEHGDIIVYSRNDQTVTVSRNGTRLVWEQGGRTLNAVSLADMNLSTEQVCAVLGFAAALCGKQLVRFAIAPVGEIRFEVEA